MSNTIRLHYQPDGEDTKIMEFEGSAENTSDVSFEFDQLGHEHFKLDQKEHYVLVLSYELKFRIYEFYSGDIVTESINPLYLEFITEEECLHCEGTGWDEEINRHCQLCCGRSERGDDGKIEVVTQKVLFDPKEYDEAIISNIVNTAQFKNLEIVYYQFHRNEIKEEEAYREFRDILLRFSKADLKEGE